MQRLIIIHMKRNLFLLFVYSAVFLFRSSCVTTQMAIYDVGLSSVESPSDAKKPYGNTDIVKYTDRNPSEGKDGQIQDKYKYTDRYIDITWWYSTTQFEFELKNISGYTLKINWDNVTYMDYTGNISRIMHKGVRYIDREQSQGSISIPKDGRLNDIIVPTSNVYFDKGLGIYSPAAWRQTAIIPCYYKNKKEMEHDIKNRTWIGKKVKILFPIEIEGKCNDYNFEFTVNGVY